MPHGAEGATTFKRPTPWLTHGGLEWKLPWLELIDDSRLNTQTRPSTLYASTARRNNSAGPQQAPSAVILAEKIRQDAQANLPGSTFLISFMPFAVVWNQTLMLP